MLDYLPSVHPPIHHHVICLTITYQLPSVCPSSIHLIHHLIILYSPPIYLTHHLSPAKAQSSLLVLHVSEAGSWCCLGWPVSGSSISWVLGLQAGRHTGSHDMSALTAAFLCSSALFPSSWSLIPTFPFPFLLFYQISKSLSPRQLFLPCVSVKPCACVSVCPTSPFFPSNHVLIRLPICLSIHSSV